MSSGIKVEIDYRMMTVIIEHGRQMKSILASNYDLSPTEFSILRSIELAGGKSKGLSTGSFLLLKHNSISVALSNLQEKGLIEKEINAQDRRSTDLMITKKGRSLAKKATEDIYQAVESHFWQGMNEEEVREAVLVGSRVNKRLTNSDQMLTNAFEDEALPISPEFIVNMSVLPKLWSQTAKKEGSLSLPEYRMLDLLVNTPEALRSFDIASRLTMDRAAISRNKDKLEKAGYLQVKQDAKDRRDVLLSPTAKGKSVEEKIHAKLQEITEELYSDLGTDEARRMNEQHVQMYETMTSI